MRVIHRKPGLSVKSRNHPSVLGADIETRLKQSAYQEHERKFDGCGTVALANASVAVPFVGGAVGALTVTQLLRLASMQETLGILQLDLGSPALTLVGPKNLPPTTSLGSVSVPCGD
jgi:hypothetical protein